jgi:hypothetical protein
MNYEHEQNKKEMKSFANKVKVDDSQVPRTKQVDKTIKTFAKLHTWIMKTFCKQV